MGVLSLNDSEADCGIPNKCSRNVPGRLILLDNAPTAALFALGTAILWLYWWPFALLYVVYCILSIILFWKYICTHCHHYGTQACPCGYGRIAPKYFPKRTIDANGFKPVFRRNIAVMFPCWLVPIIAGIYHTFSSGPNPISIALLATFCAVGFAVIPLISRLVGCKRCGIRERCPWVVNENPTRKNQ